MGVMSMIFCFQIQTRIRPHDMLVQSHRTAHKTHYSYSCQSHRKYHRYIPLWYRPHNPPPAAWCQNQTLINLSHLRRARYHFCQFPVNLCNVKLPRFQRIVFYPRILYIQWIFCMQYICNTKQVLQFFFTNNVYNILISLVNIRCVGYLNFANSQNAAFEILPRIYSST